MILYLMMNKFIEGCIFPGAVGLPGAIQTIITGLYEGRPVCCTGHRSKPFDVHKARYTITDKTALTLYRYVYRKAAQILIYLPFVSFIFYQC